MINMKLYKENINNEKELNLQLNKENLELRKKIETILNKSESIKEIYQ